MRGRLRLGGTARAGARGPVLARAPSARGFTLLEVMVALAILAGGLVVASEVVAGALRNHVRAQHLEVATLLARGKMAALEERYEWKGFRTSDEQDEGTFEDDGHPEIRWRVDVKVPPVEVSPEAVLRVLTGSNEGLKDLLPAADQAPQLAPFRSAILASMQGVLAKLGDELKRGVREVTLIVSWPEGAGEESFAVVTHMVVLQPAEGLPR